MLKPTNYAQEAVVDLSNNVTEYDDYFKILLDKSQKFVIPNGDHLLSFDISKTKFDDVTLRLPYDTVSIEYHLTKEDSEVKRIALAENLYDSTGEFEGILVMPIHYTNNVWSISHTAIKIDALTELHTVEKIKFNYVPVLTDVIASLKQQYGYIKLGQLTSESCIDETNAILRFISGYNCQNAEPVDVSKVTKKTSTSSKTKPKPKYEYKVLKLKPKRENKVRKKDVTKSKRKPPKQHTRRGCPRTYPSGKTVWIPDMIVGSLTQGLVVKDYLWEI